MNQRGCKCVGHGGAPAIAAANTLSSFDAALEHGADMIEFDVRSWQGRLVVAHYPWQPGLSAVPTLDGALTHLATPRFAGLELNADIKHLGVEAAVLDALARHGLARRTLVSSQRPAVVECLRALDPSLRPGISVGGPLARRRQRWGDWRVHVLQAVRERRVDALMAFHGLVDATLADAVAQAGGELYAWTVDRRESIERLAAMGVAGVVTGSPVVSLAQTIRPRRPRRGRPRRRHEPAGPRQAALARPFKHADALHTATARSEQIAAHTTQRQHERDHPDQPPWRPSRRSRSIPSPRRVTFDPTWLTKASPRPS